jgi:hypothetical protein
MQHRAQIMIMLGEIVVGLTALPIETEPMFYVTMGLVTSARQPANQPQLDVLMCASFAGRAFSSLSTSSCSTTTSPLRCVAVGTRTAAEMHLHPRGR